MICTTLIKIKVRKPCKVGWIKLLTYLGKTHADDEPLPLLTILDSNGLDDTLWCLRTLPEHDREWRLYAIWCARQAQHLMTDPRSLAVLDVAERYANGLATDAELTSAGNAAWDAAVKAAGVSGAVAAETAGVLAGDAWDAARDAWAAARAASLVVTGDTRVIASFAASALDAAWEPARNEQTKEFINLLNRMEQAS